MNVNLSWIILLIEIKTRNKIWKRWHEICIVCIQAGFEATMAVPINFENDKNNQQLMIREIIKQCLFDNQTDIVWHIQPNCFVSIICRIDGLNPVLHWSCILSILLHRNFSPYLAQLSISAFCTCKTVIILITNKGRICSLAHSFTHVRQGAVAEAYCVISGDRFLRYYGPCRKLYRTSTERCTNVYITCIDWCVTLFFVAYNGNVGD